MQCRLSSTYYLVQDGTTSGYIDNIRISRVHRITAGGVDGFEIGRVDRVRVGLVDGIGVGRIGCFVRILHVRIGIDDLLRLSEGRVEFRESRSCRDEVTYRLICREAISDAIQRTRVISTIGRVGGKLFRL